MLPPAPGRPWDTRALTIFGGVILSHIDMAGAVGANRAVASLASDEPGGELPPLVVTVAINRVEFKLPVFVGDVVRFLTRVVRFGRTSVTMHVAVEALRGADVIRVTEAELVYVGVDPQTRRPVPLLPGQ